MLKHLQSVILDDSAPCEPLVSDPAKLMELVTQTQGIGTWRVDLKTGTARWSDRVYDIHGIEPNGKDVDLDAAIRAYHPDDAKTVAWLVMNAIENKVGFTFILRLNRADGGTRLVQAAAGVEIGENGEVQSLYGLFKDVTDRHSERDVAEGRGRLVRSIISHSPAPLIVLDRDMRYLEISPSWIDFYQLPPAKTLIGRSHYEIMPNLPKEFRESNARALNGEIIHSRFSYGGAQNRKSTDRGAVIFPWKTAEDETGGIIVMLTEPDQLESADVTLDEIAHLFRQTSAARGTSDWVANATKSLHIRGGAKW